MSERGRPPRPELPFVGPATFAKAPLLTDQGGPDADIAVLGAPFELGTRYRAGARLAPRGIRAASTLFAPGPAGFYDHEDDVTYLAPERVRLVDAGDVDIHPTDPGVSLTAVEAGVRALLERGALPVLVGGDHTVTVPAIAAFAAHGPVHVVEFDAHLDVDAMRRAAAMGHVCGLTQLGSRGASRTGRDDYAAGRALGSTILSVRHVRDLGIEAVLARLPEDARYYVTIDVAAFDPSIAPGAGRPSHGGFGYYEALELLQGLAARGDIVGLDLVEVAPSYDPAEVTQLLAAQLLVSTLGFVMHAREERARPPPPE